MAPSAPDLSYPVAMDTVYTTNVLPADAFSCLYSYFGASGSDGYGNYCVDFQLADGYTTYGFGTGPEVTIQVPFSELMVQFPSGDCVFGFEPQGDMRITFCDTFLRSEYVNFDFGQNTIRIARNVWI